MTKPTATDIDSTGTSRRRFLRESGANRQTDYAGAHHQIVDLDPLDHPKTREIHRLFEYAGNSGA